MKVQEVLLRILDEEKAVFAWLIHQRKRTVLNELLKYII